MLHFNIQGIANKTEKLQILFDSCEPDIVCFSEHWMNAEELPLIRLENYILINSFCRRAMNRGGVCIFAKENIYLRPIKYELSLERHFEASIAVMDMANIKSKLVIIVVYRTPDSDLSMFIDKMHHLLGDLYQNDYYFIVCGDINVNIANNSCETKHIFNLFNEFNLKSHIDEPTRITGRSTTAIDVIFSDLTACEITVKDTYLSDHTYQMCKFKSPFDINNANNITIFKRDVSESNLITLKNLLNNEDWLEMINGTNFTEKFNSFYTTFMFHFNYAITYKKIKTRLKGKKWFSNELKQLHHLLCELHKLSKDYPYNIIIQNRYVRLKQLYSERVVVDKANHNNGRVNNAQNIMKESWKIINEARNYPKQNITRITVKEQTFNNTKDICNGFNNFFLNFQCPKPDFNKLILPPNIIYNFFLLPTSPAEIRELLLKTTKKSAAGIDEVGGQVLRAVVDEICTPLSYLINESFASGQYPDVLKISKSIPIYKNKGSRIEACNYRNVSVQNQFAKIFELCYNNRLISFLEHHNLLTACQNGFRKNKSTITAIEQLCEYIYNSLNNKQQPIALFFDLSRAFDTVDHNLLLEKLFRFGIRGVAHEWITSYLNNRKQAVVIGSYQSDVRDVTTGVPQGSILGPLLFLIFVNDMPNSCTSPNAAIVYADDTNFLISSNTLELAINRANKSVGEFSDWCLSNGLVLNAGKTFCMSFLPKNVGHNSSVLVKAGHQSIVQTDEIKFLGLRIDHKMTWEKHTDDLSEKLSKSCFIIRYLKSTVSFNMLKLAYFGLVQSNLSYGLMFWGNSPHASKVFVAQKKIIRCMLGLPAQTHCKEAFIALSILTLPSLYIFLVTTNIKKQENIFLKNSNVHSYDTRSNNQLRMPFSRLSVGQNSHIYQGINCYNKFTQLFGPFDNFNLFRNALQKFLISRAFYSVDDYLHF